jgi:hypothetical protein
MAESKLDHASSLRYFHTEKGDMERYCFYDEAIKLFPDVERAKRDADYANKVLDQMVEKMYDQALEEEDDGS